MGSFFVDLLSFDHETAVYDVDPKRLRFMYNTQRFTTIEEIEAFKPELVINAVTLKYTLDVFRSIMPHLPKDCIISDIASVKTGLREFYAECGMRYVSTHPMFGPTFANLGALSNENAIIISEGDYMGRLFFRDLYNHLGLHICEYTFDEHDEPVAYSLSACSSLLSMMCSKSFSSSRIFDTWPLVRGLNNISRNRVSSSPNTPRAICM